MDDRTRTSRVSIRVVYIYLLRAHQAKHSAENYHCSVVCPLRNCIRKRWTTHATRRTREWPRENWEEMSETGERESCECFFGALEIIIRYIRTTITTRKRWTRKAESSAPNEGWMAGEWNIWPQVLWQYQIQGYGFKSIFQSQSFDMLCL